MQNYVYDIFLTGMNRTRRVLGSRWINSNRFGIETPDDEINRAFANLESEVESRLSLPFGLRIMKSRWLQSTDDSSDASAGGIGACGAVYQMVRPGTRARNNQTVLRQSIIGRCYTALP